MVTGVGEGVVQPILTVTPSTLDFGSVRVGRSKELSFTVQNTGEGTLTGTATATDPFSVVTNSSFDVDAGELVLVTVSFSPPTTGPFTGTVEFASNGGDFTATVTGKGRGKLLPFREGVVSVAMDIEPQREANFLDCQSTGEMAVGIRDVLGLPLPIEVSTLELEGAVAQSWAAEDVDGDGEKDDWVVYFEIQGVSDEACQEGITSFFLTGELADGTLIEGSDEVNIVRGRLQAG
jgi:hypothetical protein